MKILIVEDEAPIAKILAANLEQAGFHCFHLQDGHDVPGHVDAIKPDLLLLDVRLPGQDGFDICRKLRSVSDLPIIFVTASTEEAERLQGFETGADDYICKPFSPVEVVARVISVLRRYHASPSKPAEAKPVLTLIYESLQARVGNATISLTSSEFRILEALHSVSNRIYSREQLLAVLRHGSMDASDRAIDSHIKNLRRKLAHIAPDENFIEAVYGEGYRLNR